MDDFRIIFFLAAGTLLLGLGLAWFLVPGFRARYWEFYASQQEDIPAGAEPSPTWLRRQQRSAIIQIVGGVFCLIAALNWMT